MVLHVFLRNAFDLAVCYLILGPYIFLAVGIVILGLFWRDMGRPTVSHAIACLFQWPQALLYAIVWKLFRIDIYWDVASRANEGESLS